MNVRRSIAGVAVALAAPALSSCGFDAPTDQIYNPAVGVNDQSGTVDVLNALIVSASDGSGTLVATLVNNDLSEDDELKAVAGTGEDQGVQVTLGDATDIPAAQLVSLAEDGTIRVEGEAVVPGATVSMTFTFDRGAAVTLDLPVVEHDSEGPYADVPVS